MANVEHSGERAGTRAERHEARMQKRAAKAEKLASKGRPAHLCSLSTVEVKKGPKGYQVIVSGTDGRRSFTIGQEEVAPTLRDLEAAIHVIRCQHE